MQQENGELSNALQKKDEENRQLAELVQDMERRMKKAQAASKTNQRIKRDIKDKEKEAHKMRKEMIDLKHLNSGLNQLLKDIKSQNSKPVSAPRLYSA